MPILLSGYRRLGRIDGAKATATQAFAPGPDSPSAQVESWRSATTTRQERNGEVLAASPPRIR
jgi:hypothetical protein